MSAEKITQGKDGLNVPNEPIIPFIIGDGIGPDIWKAASRVIDAAVEKAFIKRSTETRVRFIYLFTSGTLVQRRSFTG